jgi:oligopeptide/dipeptide ABC transporter ATP-binding protein
LSQILSEGSAAENPVASPILKVEGLTVTFVRESGALRKIRHVVKAVNNVSFDIHESEVLSVVGESGSGKTTVARCVAALAKPSQGSIRWRDKNVSSLNRKEMKDYRKNVQIIFQDPFESIYPRQDVLTTISVPIRRLTGEKDPKRIEEAVTNLLVEVGLTPELHLRRLPHQLSGGERQRVNIARALASSPKLLVADEPTTMLDASQRLNVLSLLIRLKKERNLTVLLITHDLASARLMSDRTAIMYMGKIVELGPTKTILSHPSHPYTRMILEAMPKLGSSKIGKYIGSKGEETKVALQGCAFRPRCAYATEVCSKVEPELSEKSKSQYAACHNPLS